MVSFTTPSGVSFCMDRHEVTMKQYDDFVQAVGKGPIPNHPSEWCQKYNTELLPTPPFGGEGPWCNLHDPVGHPDAAAACIDWCDAAAYCQWAGKRLCGAIGGGETPEAKLDDPMADEWLYVCTNGGKTKYPYGDTGSADKCKQLSGDAREPVLSHPECTGIEPPFSEVFNLQTAAPFGAPEYVGVAQTIPSDGLPRRVSRGLGSQAADYWSCFEWGLVRPVGNLSGAGFRCCGD